MNTPFSQSFIREGSEGTLEKLNIVKSFAEIEFGTTGFRKGITAKNVGSSGAIDKIIRTVWTDGGEGYCDFACDTLYYKNQTEFSDDRIKHNEEEIPDALDLIDQLKPYKYQKSEEQYDASYNGDISGNWRWEIGLIAQDIEKIPYLNFAVHEGPDKDLLTLNYNTFIGVLIQGVKDLNAENKTLKEDIAAIKNHLNIT